jgi:hypothetical protein
MALLVKIAGELWWTKLCEAVDLPPTTHKEVDGLKIPASPEDRTVPTDALKPIK